ncbi:MAG: sugar phosphate isomerase/epimerase [Firmicutes bacterium]|nr:sugar phosphate isomerase/epimerase [Bacillota bacterium]
MKIGISSYCLTGELYSGEMTILDVLQWAKDNGCDHIEFVPYGFTLVDNLDLADQVVQKAQDLGLEISNYCMPANFCQETKEQFDAEMARVKEHVDLLNHMGIKSLRHDVVAFRSTPEEANIHSFNRRLPQIVEGSQIIADYAAQFEITTSIENHGWGVQHSERVQRVHKLVDRENFKIVVDVGNFLCVDELPMIGVMNTLPLASHIHFKDFYYRPFYEDPGEGRWFKTVNGNFLRGSIFGQGDLPVRAIMRLIKQSGYDGYISLEFEGMEECKEGTRISLNNIRRLWEEV